ncbi:MAG: DUF4132 domain-containing protein [Raineya sp.]|jgi:hypothetical protein|nr:DUF4132 domain-containing protein [Raineya sp.]
MAFTEAELANFIASVEQRGSYYIQNEPKFVNFFDDVKKYLTGNLKNVPKVPSNSYYGWYFNELVEMLTIPSEWGARNELAFNVLTQSGIWQDLSYTFWYWVERVGNEHPKEGVLAFLWPKLIANGLKEADLFKDFVYRSYYYLMNDKNKPTSQGEFVLQKIAEDEKMVVKAFCDYQYSAEYLVRLLVHNRPEVAEKNVKDFFKVSYLNQGGVIDTFLGKDAKKYEKDAYAIISKKTDPKEKIEGFEILDKHFPKKYDEERLKILYEYLNWYTNEVNNSKSSYFYESYQNIYNKKGEYVDYMPMSAFIVDKLLQSDFNNFKPYLEKFVAETSRFNEQIVKAVEKNLKQDSIPLLFTMLKADGKKNGRSFFKTAFEAIQKHDFTAFEDTLWELAKGKNKGVRELVAVTLSKQKDKAIPNAEKMLLEGKNADTRQSGALILSLIGNEKTKKILMKALNAEKSDDARDLMLTNLADKLYKKAGEKEVAEMVTYAKERGKLDKQAEKWIDESKLPALHFQSGKKLDLDTVRFLLYRMGRAKEMKSDIEAKVVLNLIDRSKSGAFAKEIFNLYLGNGADSKQKYCLALAGLLGDDEVVQTLRSTVQRWAENTLKWFQDDKGTWQQSGEGARLKMAEYAVGALALIGSNKALRAVEFFSRKYRSKNKNIGEAAKNALKTAAEELGISPYELADSIIPDFGFEGLFKTFDIKGAEYRAFIDNDFKLAYFDENNKKLKSPPKGTPEELKTEFKEIAKEVRDIVRSQSDRLEQYMVIGRRWTKENWERFFLGNPIMFVYAIKLIWGEFDKNGKLVNAFYCSEDTTLLNLEDEEISIEEENMVGMLHPLHISEQERRQWQDKFYDLCIETIFDQMNRAVHSITDTDKNLFISNHFSGRKVDARAAVGYFEKLGWQRGSVVDGGMVSAYRKSFEEAGVDAMIEVDGIYMGWYEYDDARTGRLFFVKTGSVQFGSYTYDEPSDDKDKRLIPFKDISDIIYSEIMGDLEKIAPKPEEEQKEQA